ncbi:InlB B-repeat-containing protein, partial [Intestinibacter sp.]|uniref:InlB B-repeat-containing protein n=1 Tax=Intestinibacter sp. TaxID=1965304 RepID=UPI003F13DFED
KITTAAELVPSENYVSRVPMYITFKEAISFDEYKTICKNIFKEKCDEGLIFQESIKGSTGYNNLLDYDNAYFLIGKNQKTITAIEFNKSDDVSFIYYEDDLKYETKGDGTVPYISATMCQAVKRLPQDRYCFADGDHTQIVQNAKIIDQNGKITDKTTIEWIKQKLEIIEETSTPSDDTTSSQKSVGGGGFMVLRVACPVDVNIEANGEALNSSASEFDAQTSFGRLDIIGQNDDIKMACVDTSDDYDVTLNGNGEGTMDYTIRYFNSDDELESETTIKDVPITKDTIITTKPVSTEDTVLNVDIDGDGTVDKIYKAPKGETVDVEKVVKFNPNNGAQEIKRAVDSEGKLNYTPEAPTKAGYTFVGWFKDTDDTTTKYELGATYTEDVTYTAKWAHVDMLGAQVKAVVDDKSGIRFGTRIYNDGDEIVEKGTIILPARLLPEGESLTLDTPNIAQSIGKVNYEVNEEKNYVTYLGTLVNIPRAQFDAEITASAYVIYKDKAGNEYTVYSPYKKGSTTINRLLNS